MMVQVLPYATLKTSNAILFCKTASHNCIPLLFNRGILFSVEEYYFQLSFRALSFPVPNISSLKEGRKMDTRWS